MKDQSMQKIMQEAEKMPKVTRNKKEQESIGRNSISV
jgi:hypothetical protein